MPGSHGQLSPCDVLEDALHTVTSPFCAQKGVNVNIFGGPYGWPQFLSHSPLAPHSDTGFLLTQFPGGRKAKERKGDRSKHLKVF